MNHVPRSWLQRFQFALLVVDAFVLAIYGYGMLTGGEMHQTEMVHSHSVSTSGPTMGITALIAGIAAFHALYTISVVWWLDKKQVWLTHAIGVLAVGIMLVLMANSDSSMHILHHFILMAFVFCAAMVGTLVAGLTVALAFAFLIITSFGASHLATDPSGHIVEMILVNLSGISAVTGWFIFNKRYVQKVDPKMLASLTNRIKQERTTVGLILESITDGVMVINTEGMIEVVNDSCAKMLGWSKEDAQNLRYDTLLQATIPSTGEKGASVPEPSQSKAALAIPLAASTSEPQRQTSLINTRDGRQIYVDITASPIFGEEKATTGTIRKVVGIIAVLRDVDKQKREEQQRSEFISTASHEMRTPVAAIEGYLALALNTKVSTIDTKARSYIEKAHSSTQLLGKLFQDLLTSAKAEDGRLVNHPQAVEMGDYMEKLADSLRFSAEKKGLLLDFAIGSSPEEQTNSTGKVIKPLYYVYADPERMREVITNLFDNAVKYTESGKVSIGLTGNGDVVQLFIRDTGPGIPAPDVPHLFQKFYRVDNSATRTIGGTGLGLFITKKIVELYSGRIWVESELGKGSTFYINLPRLSAQKAELAQKAEVATAASSSPLDKP